MTRSALPTLALLAALAIAPVAAAEWYEGKEDCPPDEYCTMAAPEDNESGQAYGPEDCIECSGLPQNDTAPDDGPTAPQDCGGEVCAYDTPVDDSGSDCMDGEDAGEVCRDDVQYLGPSPDDGREPTLERDTVKESPAGGLLAALALVGAAAVLFSRR